jgi:hypothetical protein
MTDKYTQILLPLLSFVEYFLYRRLMFFSDSIVIFFEIEIKTVNQDNNCRI